MVCGKEIVKNKNWYSYMVLGKKFKVFIGTVGMMAGKKLIIFTVMWHMPHGISLHAAPKNNNIF